MTSDWVKRTLTTWDNNSFQTFIALQPSVTYAQIEPKLKLVTQKYEPEGWRLGKERVFFQPMTD